MKKKRGSALIEVLLATFIFTIIFTCETTMLFNAIRDYENYIERSKEDFYIKQALDSIKYKISENKIENMLVDNNKIKIKLGNKKSYDVTKIRELTIENRKLVINYIDSNNRFVTKKKLLKGKLNIKSFSLHKHNNTLYVKITDLKGRNFERCIGIGIKK